MGIIHYNEDKYLFSVSLESLQRLTGPMDRGLLDSLRMRFRIPKNTSI